jgi:hypothetical protein
MTFQFIGKTVQNGDNLESVGRVIAETGISFNTKKTYLMIEVGDKHFRVCVNASPDNFGRFHKVSGKGFIKIINQEK